MKEVTLSIQDNKDLMLLWNCLNFMQEVMRQNLVKHNTGNEKIDGDWLKESLDEWDRIMCLKAQIEAELKKCVGKANSEAGR